MGALGTGATGGAAPPAASARGGRQAGSSDKCGAGSAAGDRDLSVRPGSCRMIGGETHGAAGPRMHMAHWRPGTPEFPCPGAHYWLGTQIELEPLLLVVPNPGRALAATQLVHAAHGLYAYDVKIDEAAGSPCRHRPRVPTSACAPASACSREGYWVGFAPGA